jgi:hypothetical protein
VRGKQRYSEVQLTRAGIAALDVQPRGQPARGRPAARRPEQPPHMPRGLLIAPRWQQGAGGRERGAVTYPRAFSRDVINFLTLNISMACSSSARASASDMVTDADCWLAAQRERAAGCSDYGWTIGQAAVLPRSARLGLACCNTKHAQQQLPEMYMQRAALGSALH